MTAPFTLDQARTLQRSVLSVPGVADMHRGTFGEVALLFPGERISGIRLAQDRIEVHVVVKHDAGDLRALADEIRRVVSPLTETSVDVFVGDIISKEQS